MPVRTATVSAPAAWPETVLSYTVFGFGFTPMA